MAKVSRIVVRLWSAFLALIFLAVSILGIIAIVLVKKFQGLGVGLLILGLAGLAIAIAGLAGAGFEKDNTEESASKLKAGLLVLFFAAMLVLHVLFLIFGVALICISPAVKLLVTLKPDDFQKLYTSLPKKFQESPDFAIDKIHDFAIGLGVVIIIISFIIFLTCCAAAYQMGQVLFTRFFMVSFSIVEILIGLALAIFLIIINATHANNFFGNQVGSNIIVPIVVFGFVLAAIGGIGFVATCVGHKYKIISLIFNVGNVIVLIAFLVLFILCIVFNALIVGWADKICDTVIDADTQANTCTESIGYIIANTCPVEEPTCRGTKEEMEKDLEKDVGKMMKAFTTILLIVCLYLVLFLLFVVISTCVNCWRKAEESDDEASKPFINYY